MARRRISVEKIKEVVRYGVTTDLNERAIGRALQVSRIAVAKYLEWFRGSGLTWEQAQELPDSAPGQGVSAVKEMRSSRCACWTPDVFRCSWSRSPAARRSRSWSRRDGR